MPSDLTTDTICAIVTDALKAATNRDSLSGRVTAASRMGNPKEWDSLSFVAVFSAIGAAYDVELDDDDAFHFQSVSGVEAFLADVLET
jgi:acyl carrier protein